jgi:hypothetical protein
MSDRTATSTLNTVETLMKSQLIKSVLVGLYIATGIRYASRCFYFILFYFLGGSHCSFNLLIVAVVSVLASCPLGYYGTTECQPCPPGTYSSVVATYTCILASVGRYSPGYGATSTLLCPTAVSLGAANCLGKRHRNNTKQIWFLLTLFCFSL